MNNHTWEKISWRNYKINQQPTWPDKLKAEEIAIQLEQLPALVFAGETRMLMSQIAKSVEGKSFILQCGDCSEEFSRCNGPSIHRLIKVILQMSIIIAYSGEKEVVNIGRIAGQYAKPRSSEFEIIEGHTIPSYRGDMINSREANPVARIPDPSRMLEAYYKSASTLNLVRAFMHGGYASLEHVQSWHRDFCDTFPISDEYEELVRNIKKAIAFMYALGISNLLPQLNQSYIYTSHEALILEYEEAMTRIDTTTGDWYDTSAHMLWLGDRTRQADGAHVEFLRGIGNPLGIKIGTSYDIDDIKTIIQILNPSNIAGRITLIARFGADKVCKYLPPLIKGIKEEGFLVSWVCDPMHGNTYLSSASKKTRSFDDIVKEMSKFYQLSQSEGACIGGVHLELTGDYVTECVGGVREILDKDLLSNYQTSCDPRLNAEQAVEFAFSLSELLNPR